jgi:predicted DNA-binding protein with PD1-like motif
MTASACFHAFRLQPGEDLLSALDLFVTKKQLQAGWVAGVVGSLSQAALRFAGQPDVTLLSDAFEIIALGGTLSVSGSHLHLSVADSQGLMRGGHVMSGCIVRTTCELVIGELPGLTFSRQPCCLSGYDELVVTPSCSVLEK